MTLVGCVTPYTPDRRTGLVRRSVESQRDCAVAWAPMQNSGTQPLYQVMNEANRKAVDEMHLTHLAKFDSDDWSHPLRVAEQLELMESTGAWVVGYYDMPFIDERTGDVYWYSNPTKYALGTSLLFTVEAWEQHPFVNTGHPKGRGSDTEFVSYWVGRGKFACCSCIGENGEPRMIASLHDGNPDCGKHVLQMPKASPRLTGLVYRVWSDGFVGSG